MIIKYDRTSSLSQSGQIYIHDNNGKNYDLILWDKGISGSVEFNKRPEASKLISLLEAEKVTKVVFQDLSRVGRSLVDSRKTLDYIVKEKGIQVEIINQSISSHTPNGQISPIWTICISIFASIYEMERTRILELTEKGRKAALERGQVFGRKVGSTESADSFIKKAKSRQILSLLRQGKTVNDIKYRLKASPKTVRKVRKVATEFGLLN